MGFICCSCKERLWIFVYPRTLLTLYLSYSTIIVKLQNLLLSGRFTLILDHYFRANRLGRSLFAFPIAKWRSAGSEFREIWGEREQRNFLSATCASLSSAFFSPMPTCFSCLAWGGRKRKLCRPRKRFWWADSHELTLLFSSAMRSNTTKHLLFRSSTFSGPFHFHLWIYPSFQVLEITWVSPFLFFNKVKIHRESSSLPQKVGLVNPLL